MNGLSIVAVVFFCHQAWISFLPQRGYNASPGSDDLTHAQSVLLLWLRQEFKLVVREFLLIHNRGRNAIQDVVEDTSQTALRRKRMRLVQPEPNKHMNSAKPILRPVPKLVIPDSNNNKVMGSKPCT